MTSKRSRERSIDALVTRKAYWQHGLVTADQLKDLGVTRSGIRTRLNRGQWMRAAPGVFRMAGLAITWESQLLAQVLAAGAGAMASHRSAAALWKLDGFRRPGRPELVIPRTRRVERSEALVHQSTDLALVKPARRNGIPTTPVERTLLDLGAVSTRTEVLLAVDDARRQKLTNWDQLLAVLSRHARRGRDGVATLRSILEGHFDEVAKTDSGFERLVLILLTERGLPEPTVQHEVRIAGKIYRIDLAYPARRIAIELDGQIHLDREVWERDHERRTTLVNAGWRVLSFTWRQYQQDRAHIVREIRAALASTSPSPGG